MIQSLYGVKSTHKKSNTGYTVGATAVEMLKNNPNRVSFIVVNLSGNSLYMSTSPDVSSANGIYISPNGGRMILQWDVDFELVSQQWYGIATGAGSAVFILENISI